jgi:MFS family permease
MVDRSTRGKRTNSTTAAFTAVAVAASIALFAPSAAAQQLGSDEREPAPSVELGPMRVPTQLAPTRVDVDPEPPAQSAVDARAMVQERRATRVAVAGLAGLGAIALAGGVTLLGVAVPLWICSPFSCPAGSATAIALGVTLGIGSTFAVPAAYVLAASQTGVRGSYWATFGGFWSGTAVGALLTMTGIFTRLNSTGGWVVLSTISGVMPLLGMATAFELTAEPAPANSDRRAWRRAPATFAMLPSINVHEHGASLSISSVF